MPSLGSYLQQSLNSKDNLKDASHASRLYRDGVFALAPKNSWIYYVVFELSSEAKSQNFNEKQTSTELGMLVKGVDLPKFSIETEVLNQYNRKTYIQKGVKYTPVNFTFHDDQSNVVHNMWKQYFQYYYADSSLGSASGANGFNSSANLSAFQNSRYDSSTGNFDPVGYGLNSQQNRESPFFQSITIYQLNQKRYTSFQLVNPIITAWEHDKLDQTAGNKIAESRMTIAYETVFYDSGYSPNRVRKDDPSGFGKIHYDTSPSPLSVAGGGTSSVFGPGGVMDSVSGLFGNVKDTSFSGLLSTGLNAAQIFQNASKLNSDTLKAEGFSMLSTVLQQTSRGGLNLGSGAQTSTPSVPILSSIVSNVIPQGTVVTPTNQQISVASAILNPVKIVLNAVLPSLLK